MSGQIMKKNRLTGLMLGISVGFAVWGGQRPIPTLQNVQVAPVVVQPKVEQKQGDVKEDVLSLHAQSAVLLDAQSGRVLYGKNEQTIRPMASTTKIMTCILALELGDPEALCEISKKAAAQPKVKLGAPADSQIRLLDLLYSLMLESHNDSAVAIAEHISGSVEAFAELMNQKANEIGCKDTLFLTPNGLDAKRQGEGVAEEIHSTTAQELAQILRYCTEISPKRDEFLTITRTKSHTFLDQKRTRSYTCLNHNAMLERSAEAVTGKTGFTGQAGYCYVAEFSDGERKFILALLGCGWPPHKTWKWEDVQKLYRYGKEHFFYQDFSFSEEPVRVKVENGADKEQVLAVSDTPGAEKHFRLLVSEADQVRAEKQMKKLVPAPVRKQDLAGTIVYRLNEMEIGRSCYRIIENAEEWNLFYCFFQVLRHLFQIEK